jgi:glycyl-tRNA synthetase alpha chain
LDGLEITQFTYFQQCGGVDLDPIAAELTYGLERLCAFLQDVDSVYDIIWARDSVSGDAISYGEVRFEEELQFSVYNFQMADVTRLWTHLREYEAECKSLIDGFAAIKTGGSERERFPLLAAYDLCLKCSHIFNLLDARGAISVTERVGVIARIRALAIGIAKAYVEQHAPMAAESKHA